MTIVDKTFTMRPVQLAYVVDDPESAARAWATQWGAGPFFLRRHIAVTDAVYFGVPTLFDHTSAYGQAGDMMIELFCQHNLDPTPVRDWPADRLHHIAYFAESLAAETARLASLGIGVAMTAMAGQRFTFFDTATHLGHYLECYEPSPRLLGFYEMVRQSSVGWQGCDPVRMI